MQKKIIAHEPNVNRRHFISGLSVGIGSVVFSSLLTSNLFGRRENEVLLNCLPQSSNCKDILQSGVFTTDFYASETNFYQYVKKLLKTNHIVKKDDTLQFLSSAGITLPIEGTPVPMEGTGNLTAERKRYYSDELVDYMEHEQNFSQRLFQHNQHEATSVIHAWLTCMQNVFQRGLTAWVEYPESSDNDPNDRIVLYIKCIKINENDSVKLDKTAMERSAMRDGFTFETSIDNFELKDVEQGDNKIYLRRPKNLRDRAGSIDITTLSGDPRYRTSCEFKGFRIEEPPVVDYDSNPTAQTFGTTDGHDHPHLNGDPAVTANIINHKHKNIFLKITAKFSGRGYGGETINCVLEIDGTAVERKELRIAANPDRVGRTEIEWEVPFVEGENKIIKSYFEHNNKVNYPSTIIDTLY